MPVKFANCFAMEKRINIPVTKCISAFEESCMNDLGVTIGCGNELDPLNSLGYITIYITEFNALFNAVYGRNFNSYCKIYRTF